MWKLLIFSGLFFIAACSDSSQKNSNENAGSPGFTEKTEVDEDELILRLSSFLTSDALTQSKKNQNAIVNYAIDHLLDIYATPSGLFYQILDQGEGKEIVWGDKISVNYKGYFMDGTVFDSSYKRSKPLNFYVGNLIDGWNEGLQLINVGGKIRLLVPSQLAYGEDGLKDRKGKILVPSNSNLIFEIEVLPGVKNK